MSIVQKLISSTYSFRMKLSKLTGMGIHVYKNIHNIKAPESFYALKATSNQGEEISFEQYKGKKVLIVNLASQCGYTPQYAELESLHRQNKDVVVLGFPANNFGKQEPGTDQEIAAFCQLNFGVSFPLFKKEDVKGLAKQNVYQWLTNKNKNGWNDTEPKWNFYKYLIDENGNLINVSSSSVAPAEVISSEITK